jgi:DNA mismatch repair protein MSH2
MAAPAKPTEELALDDASSRKFARFYRALVDEKDGSRGEGDATTTTRVVRFFDRKEFMSAHGDDAVYIARTFYKVRDALLLCSLARAVRGRDARDARDRGARRVDAFKL